MDDRATERRALADKIRHDHARSSRRRQLAVMILVVVGVLVCVAVMVWLQFRGNADASAVMAPQHANEQYGFTLTSELVNGGGGSTDTPAEAPTQVSVYEDFLCPSCKIFYEESGDYLLQQVAEGNIVLTYHPFTFLLNNSTDEYTQRAANAAVCVGDSVGPVGYAHMHGLLMEHQPAQAGAGLADAQLLAFAEQSGAPDVAECIAERTFTPWVEAALHAGQKAGVTVTPTVRVDGFTVVRSDDGRESIPGPDEISFAIESVR